MPEIGSLYVSLGLNTAQFDRQLPATADKLKVVEKATGNVRYAVQNLGFQLNDIATSLASGGSPFRVLAQQGGQIVQVFQQGGGVNRVLGAAATAIRGLVTPTTLAVGGLTALGVAFAGLVGRAQSDADQLKRFALTLDVTGRGALTTAENLQRAAREMRRFGLSRAEAETTALSIARNPVLNPAAAGRIAEIGANLGAFSGTGSAAGITQFTGAISAGAPAVAKLAADIGALNAQQLANILTMIRHGDQAGAMRTAIDALDTKLKDFEERTLTQTERASRKLSTAWDDMLTVLSKTAPIEGARQGITGLMDVLGNLLSNGPAADSPLGAILGSLPSTGDAQKRMVDQMNAVRRNSGISGPGAAMAAAAARGQRLVSLPPPPINMEALGVSPGLGDLTLPDPVKQGQAIDKLRELTEAEKRNTAQTRLWGIEQQVARAASEARTRALAETGNAELAEQAAQTAATETRKRANIELGKEITLQDMRTAALRKVAEALKVSEAEAEKVAAFANAEITARQRGGNASGIAQRDLAEKAAARAIDLQRAVNDNRRSVALVNLEASLQGESANQIERQLTSLRAKQFLEEKGESLTSDIAQNYLRSVDALNAANDRLARQRETWDQLREVGAAFESSFSRIFDSLLDGTFKLKNAIKDLAGELLKTVSSQAFHTLMGGTSSTGGGFLGLIGGLFGLGGGSSSGGGDFGGGGAALGVPDAIGGSLPAFAGGGSFEVGGSGGIDSQLVAFNATPGEMVNITHGDQGGGSTGPIRIELNPSEGWVAGIADQRIVTSSGQIIQVAVKQSQATVQRNLPGMLTQSQARAL